MGPDSAEQLAIQQVDDFNRRVLENVSAVQDRVHRGGAMHEVALADLECDAGSELGLVVAAYRRWQGRGYRV